MELIKSLMDAIFTRAQPVDPTARSPTDLEKNLEGGLATQFNPSMPSKRGPRQTTCVPSAKTLANREAQRVARIRIFDDRIILLGYPSRGGVIFLERAGPVEFDFLKLSRLEPPLARALDPAVEDEFCQRLLLIGGMWFDSHSRNQFMAGLRENSREDVRDLEMERRPALTLSERRWVVVGWPREPAGSLWVGEWDTNLPGILEDELVPDQAARVTLATNMEERCAVIRRLGGTFYKSLDEYHGAAYLNAWTTKWEGEVEPLEQTW